MLLVFLIALTPFRADKVAIFKEENESIIHLIGNVVIENEATRITCSEALISEAKGLVRLVDRVRISDENGEVNAKNAVYFFNEDRGYLSDSVTIITEDQRMLSDSLYYDGGTDSVEMYGNVLIEDQSNDMVVTGDRGWYNLAREEGLLSGSPELRIMRHEKTPITVYANAFRLLTADDLFMGAGSVHAIIDSIDVFCDTFSYDLQAETGEMTNPSIREKKNELKGIRGRFRLKRKEMDLLSVSEGQSVYHTEEGSVNMVKGDTIEITFREGKAVAIRVEGQPEGMLNMQRRQEDASD
jgi:lipopolysaccharide export system protein LptA